MRYRLVHRRHAGVGMMEVKIPTSKIREVLESSGYAYTPDNIAAVRANIPLHTSDLILAALNATDLPDKRFALPLF